MTAKKLNRRRFLRLSMGVAGSSVLGHGFLKLTRAAETSQSLPQSPAALAAQTGTRPSRRESMFVAMAGSPLPLDPTTALGVSWPLLYSLIYNPLYSWDKGGKLFPDLASDFPQMSGPGRVYTVPLKRGAKFHNGREVKAHDVKFSLERATRPSTRGWASGFITNLVGVDEVAAGVTSDIKGIKVLDDYTIQFTLKNPQAVFIQNLGLTPHAIVPREEVEKWGDKFGLHPVGTGPYKVVEWEPDVRFVLERHDQFHESGKPSIRQIYFRLRTDPDVAFLQMQRGEIDLLWDGIPEGRIPEIVGKREWANRYASTSGVTALRLYFNTKWPVVDDKRVRQALSLAVNRRRVLELYFNRGLLPNDILEPLVPGYKADRPLLQYAPDRAKQLLDQVGIPAGFRIRLAFRGAGAYQATLFGRVAASLQQDLQQIGIGVDLVQIDPSNYPAALKDPKFTSAYIHAWTPDYPDPYDHYFFAFSCSGARAGTNRSFYCNDKAETLVSQAEQQRGLLHQRRIQLYQQVADLMLEDPPATPLLYTVADTVHSARIRNFAMHPLWLYSYKDYAIAG